MMFLQRLLIVSKHFLDCVPSINTCTKAVNYHSFYPIDVLVCIYTHLAPSVRDIYIQLPFYLQVVNVFLIFYERHLQIDNLYICVHCLNRRYNMFADLKVLHLSLNKTRKRPKYIKSRDFHS